MENNYSNWSRQELIEHIRMLEDKFRSENDRFIVNFPWAGNLGQWVWYYDRNVVHFNDRKITQLGYDAEVVGHVGFEFFTNKLHPDDYDRVMDNMKKHLMGITPVYEVEYRIQHCDGHYIWYYDRGTVTKRTPDGRPLMLEGIVFDITESKLIQQRLVTLSERDALTKAYNRRMLFVELQKNIEKYLEQDIPFSLIMFDIDRFKDINDTFGHLVGDDVLVALTNLVNEDKRSKDRVFRYGGDEFFILLPHTDYKGALKVAERLNQIVSETKFPKVGSLSISIGVAEYQKQTDDEFIALVDQLMYEAKNAAKEKQVD
ncbi:MAG: diguanylate cyclase [Bacilli bacterium]